VLELERSRAVILARVVGLPMQLGIFHNACYTMLPPNPLLSMAKEKGADIGALYFLSHEA